MDMICLPSCQVKQQLKY
uniref:Uncharacterized protein n=1 Tax=Anguilla anguilla TaxID=7936 RepID=A0A0E9X9L3_ANGAN